VLRAEVRRLETDVAFARATLPPPSESTP